jgi:hypothetical protein
MPGHTLQPLPMPGAGATLSTRLWRCWWRALLRRVAGLGVDLFRVRLTAGQELQLHEVAGWTVVCRSGVVWITQETDARDIFLNGGEGFALDRGGLAIVRACRDAMVAIRAPAGRVDVHRSHSGACGSGAHPVALADQAQLNWVRSLYPESGPWNDPASYRREGLL